MATRSTLVIGASLAVAVALCSPAARAQFYIGGEGGWTGLNDSTSHIGGVPIKETFDSGFNVGARAGYQWNAWRFEGEYSYSQNRGHVKSLGTTLSGDVDINWGFANAIYDFNVGWPVTPHIGGGVGVADVSSGLNVPGFGAFSKGSGTVFAYQAIAGLRYDINPNWVFDLDYRYRGTGDVTFHTVTSNLARNGLVLPSLQYKESFTSNNVVASISYLFGAPPPPVVAPAAIPAPPPPPARQVFQVFFDWDRDAVTPAGMGVIQQAADAVRSGAPVQIQVTGYTDRSGSPGYNQRLSERRANNVANAMAGMGVSRSQMAVSGRGENDNRVPTADGVREPQNRRVEITAS